MALEPGCVCLFFQMTCNKFLASDLVWLLFDMLESIDLSNAAAFMKPISKFPSTHPLVSARLTRLRSRPPDRGLYRSARGAIGVEAQPTTATSSRLSVGGSACVSSLYLIPLSLTELTCDESGNSAGDATTCSQCSEVSGAEAFYAYNSPYQYSANIGGTC